jgi:hypothetical protein
MQVAAFLGIATASVVLVSVPFAVASAWSPALVVVLALGASVAATACLRRSAGDGDGHWSPVRIAVWASLTAVAALNARNYAHTVETDRDPGLYYLKARLLLDTGGTRAEGNPAIMDIPGTFETTGPGLYDIAGSDELFTQFLSGPSALQALGLAVFPVSGAMLASVFLTWLASIALFEVLARAVGSVTAGGAALASALSLPWVYFGRATYSEPAAAALLLVGLMLAAAAVRRPSRCLGLLAGLVLGATLVCRVDAVLALGPALIGIAYVGSRTPEGRRVTVATAVGLAPGVIAGITDARLLTPEYIADLAPEIRSITLVAVACGVAVVALLVLGSVLGRSAGRDDTGGAWWRRLDIAAAALLAVAAIAFGLLWFAGPVLIPGGDEPVPGVVAELQRQEGLPLDPHDYSEWLGQRLAWSVGAPLLVAALAGLAAGGRRIASTPELAPLVFAGVVTALAYATVSAITPDMPWALRRLFPAVIPAAAALAAVGIDTLLPRRAAIRAGAAALVVAGAVGTSLPMLPSVEREGVLTTMTAVCDEVPKGSLVYVVDGSIGQWVRPLAGLCDVDAVRGSQGTEYADLVMLAERAEAANRDLFVLAERSDYFLGAPGVDEDLLASYRELRLERTLARPPRVVTGIDRNVWLYRVDPDEIDESWDEPALSS